MKFFIYGVQILPAKMMSVMAFSQFVGVGKLSGYQLLFNKKSHKDESGLANLVLTHKPEDAVFGAIYEISEAYKGTLERVEGIEHGYHEIPVTVSCQGQPMSVKTFICDDAALTQEGLKPFHWYKAMMLKGAKERTFPAEYIDYLEKYEALTDTDAIRIQSHAGYL